MNGDFTRDTFPYAKTQNISRVLMQQGRVLLDADWNEQVSILLHYLRSLAVDLIGPHGGNGFAITPLASPDDDFTIGSGHYYVNGVLCEIEPPELIYRYRDQPNHKIDEDQDIVAGLAYLDVWERHFRDDYFREKALNGPDTAIRAQAVWQVKVLESNDELTQSLDELILLRQKQNRTEQEEQQLQTLYHNLQDFLNTNLIQLSPATLRARIEPSITSDDPCILPPTAGYRGNENQLYRVEIHDDGSENVATFKWSRDNGSVTTGWLGTDGDDLIVENARGFAAGQWVELTYNRLELDGKPGTLAKLTGVEGDRLAIDSATKTGAVDFRKEYKHPAIRRWDHTENGLIPVRDGIQPEWVNLENGIQIQFQSGKSYRTGDYWLIPARTATGNVEWPIEEGGDGNPQPVFQPPHGTKHHYAPLARVTVANGKVTAADDLRRIIKLALLP